MFIPEIEREVYLLTIQKLIFHPCISVPEIVDIVIEQEVGEEKYQRMLKRKHNVYGKKYYENYEYDYNRAKKELKRLLAYLVPKENKSDNLSELLRLPKRYDDILRANQIELYNKMVTELNRSTRIGLHIPLIENTISESIAMEYLKQGGVDPTSEWVHKLYPYLHFGERNGFNYLECIILLNIIFSQGSLNQLERLINREVSKDIARKWVEQVLVHMRSNSMRQLYIDIFFTTMYNVAVDRDSTLAEEIIRKEWLPEKYRQRQDWYNAFVRYGEWQDDSIWDGENSLEDYRFSLKALERMDLHTTINDAILPAWNTLNQKNAESGKTHRNLSEVNFPNIKEKKACQHLAREYMRASLDSAKKILNKFLIC